MTIESKTVDRERKERDARLEAEHGPMVFLAHPDGSEFGFRLMTRDEYETHRRRVKRGDAEATERLLQERCVFPSREAWNQYVAESVLEPMAYGIAYREAHGAGRVRECDPDEVPPEGLEGVNHWLTNGAEVFGFRKPGRAESKLFQAKMLAETRGEKQKEDPLETLLRSCAVGDAFHVWLEGHLFGVTAFGDAFMSVCGFSDVRVTGK
jgi:hypothetical protein